MLHSFISILALFLVHLYRKRYQTRWSAVAISVHAICAWFAKAYCRVWYWLWYW